MEKILTVPEEVGLSSHNLLYIDDVMERAIREKIMKGAVTLVARHGKVIQHKAFGQSREGIPMKTDAIFRLASMSKPIGAAALLQLFDQGKVMPSDKVSDYIPAFKEIKKAVPDRSIHLFSPNREITVHDLLTMRSGITARRALLGDHKGAKYCADLYVKTGIIDTMHPLDQTIEEVTDLLATMPIATEPGERWDYSNLSSVVAGRIVEIVSEMNLRDYLRKNLFEPLEMYETDFFPEEKYWDRIPDVYACHTMECLNGLDVPGTDDTQLPFASVKKYYNIAAGLNGTVEDYYHFAQMLCDKGKYKGRRILSPNAVNLMTTNHIGAERTSLYGHGWGYMVNVQEDYNTEFNYMGIGSYGWHGYWGSVFNVWPKKDLVAIFISQVSPVDPSWKVQERFLNVVANSLLE